MRKTLQWLIGGIVAFCLFGCSEQKPSVQAVQKVGTKTNYYAVTGMVQTVSQDLTSARIAHEEIPDYMEAMTMTLPVQDTNELRGIIAGDKITFRMVVTEDDGWIDQVKRVESGSQGEQKAEPSEEPIQFMQVGSVIPDLVLTNQFGKEINVSDFRGKVLAFTFIFTRCPFPVYCPRLNSHFTDVQQRLKQQLVSSNWHLLSISFDPKTDTPAVLHSYAQRYKFDPGFWTFATGPEDHIRRFGAAFGLNFMAKNGTIDHNVRTVVVDENGKVVKIFPNTEWNPEELTAAIMEAVKGK